MLIILLDRIRGIAHYALYKSTYLLTYLLTGNSRMYYTRLFEANN